ncbi:MAG TPA: hypothetical protein VFO89_02945, partial [Thermoanaerobaculia bacterium]|nr:hypothetical protein [Thermoanaerobaculia bacterium]
NILQRIDRGEGLLGEMTTAPETKQRLTDTLLTTLNKTNAALAHMESGKGVMGKMIYDDAYAEQLTTSLGSAAQSLASVTGNLERSFTSGDGLVPSLMNDPAAKTRFYEVVENLRVTSDNLAKFTTTMQNGEGLVPRLLSDKEYGDQALTEFTSLVRQLNEVATKLNQGDGTAGKIINDPAVYESINDILIGINESKLLRWLIRNRQQAGINKRVEEVQKAPQAPHAEPPPPLEPVPDVDSVVPPSMTDTTGT